MAVSDHPLLLAVAVLSMVLQSLMFGAALVDGTTLVTDIQAPTGITDLSGIAGFVLDVVGFVLGIPELIFSLVTFSAVPGLPGWVRAAMSLYMLLVLGPPLMRLLVGLVEGLGSVVPFT